MPVAKDLLLLLGQIIQPPHILVCPPAKQLQNTGYMKLEEGFELSLSSKAEFLNYCKIQKFTEGWRNVRYKCNVLLRRNHLYGK